MVNEVLYEDNHIIVVNKITGDIIQNSLRIIAAELERFLRGEELKFNVR